jgi:hypothetical protein
LDDDEHAQLCFRYRRAKDYLARLGSASKVQECLRNPKAACEERLRKHQMSILDDFLHEEVSLPFLFVSLFVTPGTTGRYG